MTTPNWTNTADIPADAANYGGLAAFAAKTQTDWENEFKSPFETNATNFVQGLFGDLPLGEPFGLTLVTEIVRQLIGDPEAVFTSITDALGSIGEWAISLVVGGISAVLQQFETFLNSIPSLSTWLDTLKTVIDSLLSVTGLSTFLDTLKTVINSFVSITGLSTFLDTLKTVIESFVSVTGLSTFLDIFKTLINGLTGIANFESWVGVFKTLINGLAGIVNFETWVTTFKTLINGLLGITNFENWVGVLKQITDFFNGIAGNVRGAFLTAMKTVVDFFNGLIGEHGSLETWLSTIPVIGNVLELIKKLTGNDALDNLQAAMAELTTWTQKVPVLGTLVTAFLGQWTNPATGTNNTLPDLIAFAQKLLTVETAIPSINLFGFLPFDLLSMIPVGHVGNSSPNLVSDTGFETEAAIQAGNGWSWAGTTNNTNSTGGSANVVCDGGVRQLLSNMIQVAEGQTIDLSAAIKWTKPSGATPTFLIGLRGYDQAGSITFTQTVASVIGKIGYTTPNSSSAYSVGANTTATVSGGWVTISGTTSPIAAGTTQVRMLLGVTNGPAGTTAWFDDALAQKSQLLQQDLVSGLIDDLLAKLPGGDFQALLATIAKTPGATLTTVANAIAGFLTGSSALNGSNILFGNIGAAFIKDLADTWSNIVFGISGGNTALTAELQAKYSQFQQGLISASQFTSYLTTVLTAPANSLQDFVKQMTGQGGRISQLEIDLPRVRDRVTILENSLNATPNGVLARLTALEQKANFATVTPPSTAPTIITVTDDFERASLGSNWTTTQVNLDGSTIGIPNSRDVQFSAPSLSSTCSQVALAWNGTGRASNTGFQRISTTLATSSSNPLAGSPGFNDLIAKASATNPLYGLVCRYYANGVVKFFYRLGAWEIDFFNPATTVGTFTAPAKPMPGTLFEFYAGDKSVSDQTKCFAKIGTAVIGPVYYSSTALGQIASNGGTGWGFGMGNGLSGFAPQPSASLNYWSAQDQV